MQVGQRVGPFDIERQIGSGAMGAVYQARYRKNGRRVALKVIHQGLGASETSLARFEREKQVLKQLSHRNIVQVYDAELFKGAPFYVMEFIEGEPLDDLLQRRGRLPWEEVVELGKQVCAALKHAHDQGIVHRDIKPSNLMVTADGTVKLTDFGIAKDLDVTQLTAANCTVGTASYMSPEQCRGERDLTFKSDLYSLGVVFYELLTGQRPFLAETTMDMFLAHVHGTFERPSRLVLDIPIWLDTLVCQLMEKDPSKRPFDAAVVGQALEQVAEKVAAQRSAGVDRAQARVMDRRTLPAVDIDDTDKEAARTLLSTLRKGRRKRRGPPFYEKTWFRAAGILAILAGVSAILFEVFRKPSATVLLQHAQKAMQSSTFEDRLQARRGRVAEFLRYYPDHEQAAELRKWADGVDREWAWTGLHNRRKMFNPDGDSEARMRAALAFEEEGKLTEASEQWQPLVKLKDSEDEKEHGRGLLAERRVEDIQAVTPLEEALLHQLADAHNQGRDFKPADDAERLAAEALLFEYFEDYARARSRWIDFRLRYQKDLDHGSYALLASRKIADLKDRVPDDKEELNRRRAAVRKKLREADSKEAQDGLTAMGIYRNILTLYEKETDPEIAEVVTGARKQLEALAVNGNRPGKE
jgi:serine/threonine-protein kinase